MTKQVQLVGGSLDGQIVTVTEWATTYDYFKSGVLDRLRMKPCVRVESYSDRGGNKFWHVLTEKRELP